VQALYRDPSNEHRNVTPRCLSLNLKLAHVSWLCLAGFAVIDGVGTFGLPAPRSGAA
jgi:hypothetical protein